MLIFTFSYIYTSNYQYITAFSSFWCKKCEYNYINKPFIQDNLSELVPEKNSVIHSHPCGYRPISLINFFHLLRP